MALDLVTPPAIEMSPGKLIDTAGTMSRRLAGGYRRIDGYERYDGHASPTAQSYWILNVSVTGSVAVGNTFFGATSGATGVVLAIDSLDLVVG